MAKLKVLGTRIQIKIDDVKAGSLDISSLNVAKEVGTVVALGDEVTTVKVGDKIMFKSWAVDIIVDNGDKYYFIDLTTGGVCAIFK